MQQHTATKKTSLKGQSTESCGENLTEDYLAQTKHFAQEISRSPVRQTGLPILDAGAKQDASDA